MKKDILDRYERNEDGEVIIDIAAEEIKDLYDDFDKRSPFLKKDLDQNLVEYMIDSVKEIENEKFIIRFDLETYTDEESISRVKNSINKFFVYMQELESRKMHDMMRTSSILFFVGLVIVVISVLMNQSYLVKTSIIAVVVAEGLTVAAWVSLWEALATILIKWIPHKKKITLYKRIANAKVEFNFSKKAVHA
ncbi:MAG: hypothetical protein R3331_08625 [Sulfurospirillaceae bacterium]|nr:hypothetical protein [Sulfurospirillaceae bacterium]